MSRLIRVSYNVFTKRDRRAGRAETDEKLFLVGGDLFLIYLNRLTESRQNFTPLICTFRTTAKREQIYCIWYDPAAIYIEKILTQEALLKNDISK